MLRSRRSFEFPINYCLLLDPPCLPRSFPHGEEIVVAAGFGLAPSFFPLVFDGGGIRSTRIPEETLDGGRGNTERVWAYPDGGHAEDARDSSERTTRRRRPGNIHAEEDNQGQVIDRQSTPGTVTRVVRETDGRSGSRWRPAQIHYGPTNVARDPEARTSDRNRLNMSGGGLTDGRRKGIVRAPGRRDPRAIKRLTRRSIRRKMTIAPEERRS